MRTHGFLVLGHFQSFRRRFRRILSSSSLGWLTQKKLTDVDDVVGLGWLTQKKLTDVDDV